MVVSSFELGGREYKYYFGVRPCERRVEIPFALNSILETGGPHKVLEVGEVLNRYEPWISGPEGFGEYRLCDKFALQVGCTEKQWIKADLLDIQPTWAFDAVSCISTIEHVGFDYTDRGGLKKTRPFLEALDNQVAEDGVLVVTCPINYRPEVEPIVLDFFADGEVYFMRTINPKFTEWEECSLEEARKMPFSRSKPKRAAAVMLCRK